MALAALPATLAAQEVMVPVDLQYRLFARILSYDRELLRNGADEVVVGVVYQELFRTSKSAKEEFVASWKAADPPTTIQDQPLRVVEVHLTDIDVLAAAIEREAIDVLFITPLRAVDIRAISVLSRARGVLTFSATPEYVEQGLTVGIDLLNRRPQILINRGSAEAEGAFFSGRLLQLARLVETS